MLRICAIIALSGLCLCASSCDQSKRRNQKEAIKEINASKDEMLDSMVMTDEGLTVDVEKAERARQNLAATGEKMGGKAGEAIKIAAELQGTVAKQGEKCIEAAAEVGPYFDMESFSVKRDYATGIEKFRKLISVNEATLAAFENFKPELAKRLDEISFTGKDRRDFDAGFHRKWGKTYELVKVIRDADIELGKTGIALMEGLKSGDSQWQWDEKAGQISLQIDEQVEWYNSHTERISELGEKQRKAQEELMKHIKAP